MCKLYSKEGFDIRSWDIVRLSNGNITGVIGTEFQNDIIDENTTILLTTSPISSFVSTCYPEHIVEVIEHCGCFENMIDYMFKHNITNKLYIKLERGEKVN